MNKVGKMHRLLTCLLLIFSIVVFVQAGEPFEWKNFVESEGRKRAIDILMDLRRPEGGEEAIGRWWTGYVHGNVLTIARDGTAERLSKNYRHFYRWFVTKGKHPHVINYLTKDEAELMVVCYILVEDPVRNGDGVSDANLCYMHDGRLVEYGIDCSRVPGTNMPSSWQGPAPMSIDGGSRSPVYAEKKTLDMWFEENAQYAKLARWQGTNQTLYLSLMSAMKGQVKPEQEELLRRIRQSIFDRTQTIENMIRQCETDAELLRAALSELRAAKGSPIKE